MSEEHKIQFGTLQPSGELTNRREIKQTDVASCPHLILVPEHYGADGKCLCNDAEHRKMMIEKWGYTPEDFNT